MRVVIAAGGTAGHVVPALAVADALVERGASVSFVGTRDRAEAKLVPDAGYEIDFLNVSGIDRRNPLRAALALGRAAVRVRGGVDPDRLRLSLELCAMYWHFLLLVWLVLFALLFIT